MLTVEENRVKTVLKTNARQLTSGRIPQVLIKMIHPFARRWGMPLFPRLPINVDTRRLQQGWRFRRLKKGGGTLYNMAPHTQYILKRRGTRYMFARGFWAELTKRYKRHLAAKVRRKREAER